MTQETNTPDIEPVLAAAPDIETLGRVATGLAASDQPEGSWPPAWRPTEQLRPLGLALPAIATPDKPDRVAVDDEIPVPDVTPELDHGPNIGSMHPLAYAELISPSHGRHAK